MKRFHRTATVLAVGLGSLALSASASASIVSIGHVATGTPLTVGGGGPITDVQVSLPEAGAHVVSPVDGAIVRWHLEGFEGGPFRLRIFTLTGTGSYTAAGTSAAVTGVKPKLETFDTDLPIKAGQAIGIEDSSPNDRFGIFQVPGATYTDFSPLAEGETVENPGTEPGNEFDLSAEVQPSPTITSIAPATGSFKGGAAVSITGTDFEGATAVSFGSQPAAGFTVDSETQITATAPPMSGPMSLPVAVATVAGTATAAAPFVSTACVVPRLKGKKLKAAKKILVKADCKIGTVTKLDGATAKTGKTTKQSPKAGKLLAPGARVKLTLKR